MPEDKLKPCPFCGEEAGPEIDGDEYATINATYTIFCNGCHASAATENTYAEAVARWNTRLAISATGVEGLLEALRQIAERRFNCSPHQHGMAAASCAERAIAKAGGQEA